MRRSTFTAPWAAENVTMYNCGPGYSVDITDAAPDDVVEFYHSWRNDNDNLGTEHSQAYVKATVTLDGQPVPITVDPEHPYRRQADASSYEIMIGPAGATHTVPFEIRVADLPVSGEGEFNISFGATNVTKRQQGLAEF